MKNKTVSAFLALSVFMSSISPVYAADANTDDSIVYTTIKNTDNITQSETTVTAKLGSKYQVILPKTMEINNGNNQYSVKVQGDIKATESVDVVPDSNFQLTSQNKTNVTANIEQEKQQFAFDEIYDNEKTATGIVSVSDLSAGHWNGTFNFNVSLADNELPLVTLTTDKKNPLVNSSIVLSASVKNGKSPYLYQFRVRKAGTSDWTNLSDFSETSSYKYQIDEINTFDFSVIVKDANDKTSEAIISLSSKSNIGDDAKLTKENDYGIAKTGDVTIPDTITDDSGLVHPITSIGDIFNDSDVSSVTIPSSIKSISDDAFNNCNNLKYISFNGKKYDNLTDLKNALKEAGVSVSDKAFSNSKFPEFVDGDDITLTADKVSSDNMTTIPDYIIDKDGTRHKVTGIGNNAFSNSDLTTITIPSSVTSIGSNVFPDTINTIIYNGKTYNNKTGLINDLKKNGVSVDDNAFANINLPECVDGDDITLNAATVKQFNIPITNDTTIPSYVIDNNGIKHKITVIGDGVFNDSVTSVSLPDTITIISDNAFVNGTNLNKVVFKSKTYTTKSELIKALHENNVTVSDTAFKNLAMLEYVDGGNITLSSNNLAKFNITPSGTVTIPEIVVNDVTKYHVVGIADNAFSNSSVENVVIPTTVTSIGANAFTNSKLASITYNNIVFHNYTGAMNALKKANCNVNASSFTNAVIPQYEIGKSTLLNAGDISISNNYQTPSEILTDDGFKHSVIGIGNSAFSGNNVLSSITITDNIKSIGNNAFVGSNLSSVIFNGKTYDDTTELSQDLVAAGISVGENAFANTKMHTYKYVDGMYIDTASNMIVKVRRNALPETLNVPSDVQIIAENMLNAQENMKIASLPDSIKNINNAFVNCSNLESVVYKGKTYTNIYDLRQALKNNNVSYQKISWGTTKMTNQGPDIIVNNSNYNSYNIGTSGNVSIPATSIDSDGTVHDITEVVGNGKFDSVQTIALFTNKNMFNSNRNVLIKSLKIPDTIKTIGDGAFYNCNKISNVVIPNSVTSIGNGAFANDESLTSITLSDNIKSIGEYTFAHAGLTSVTYKGKTYNYRLELEQALSANNVTFSITSFALNDLRDYGDNVTLTRSNLSTYGIKTTGDVIIPNVVIDSSGTKHKVTQIGDGNKLFSSTNGITSVKILTGPTEIAANAFAATGTGIPKMIVSRTVVVIGNNAFAGVNEVAYNGSASGAPWGANKIVTNTETDSILSGN